MIARQRSLPTDTLGRRGRANSMSKTRRGQSSKFSNLLGAGLGPGNKLALAQTVEGMLIADFTRGFDGMHDGLKVTIRAEIVAIDHSSILKVFARQRTGSIKAGAVG